MGVKITERGWPGHYICSDRCTFRRNTLIEGENDSVIVSTVGAFRPDETKAIEPIGICGRFYETKVFGIEKVGPYIDADVRDERRFKSKWGIHAGNPKELPKDVDNVANDMHEAVVAEFVQKLEEDNATNK